MGIFEGLANLLQQIRMMKQHGTNLTNSGASKGIEITDLSEELTTLINSFNDKGPGSFDEFSSQFTKLLHSKDKQMSEYRVSWETICKNIAIAWSVIGLFAIAGKLIHSRVTEGRALFFYQKNKTSTEEYLADMESTLTTIESLTPKQGS